MNFIAHPFRLKAIVDKHKGPDDYVPTPQKKECTNRSYAYKADTIDVFLDKLSLLRGRSIGTKLELAYAIRSRKLRNIYFNGCKVGSNLKNYLVRILSKEKLPTWDAYVNRISKA